VVGGGEDVLMTWGPSGGIGRAADVSRPGKTFSRRSRDLWVSPWQVAASRGAGLRIRRRRVAVAATAGEGVSGWGA
jgi:hypothetical protein